MKKIIFILLLALAATVSYAQTHTGDLFLSSQAEVDAFSYTEVMGNLTIGVGNITNLNSLSELTNIGGYLWIRDNPSLPSLSGLESLTEIGGFLWIRNNPSLTSLSSLGSLTDIGGNLDIQSNGSLSSLSGLGSLTEIGGNLSIQSNTSLPSLSGLEMLESIGGRLSITGNTALTDFCAISSLIGDDKQITSGEYTLDTNGYNPSYGLISNETFCSNADGGIFVGNLTLETQASIDAFSYRGIIGDLTIDDAANGNITNLDSLRGLIEVRGFLSVRRNDSLTSLRGLEDLIRLEGTLYIGFNASLPSLSGLDALTTVNGILRITNNTSLTSLSGLEMLKSIGEVLTITENTDLTDFCAVSSLIGDDKQITSGEYTVNTNGYNPSYGFISNEAFCSNADGGIFVGDLTLETQASIDAFRYRGVTGNLIIDESVANDITNLDSLGSLTDIGGNLDILSNASLPSLSGLEMLESIGGRLSITENTALTDFCAVSSLIGDDKQITSGEYTVSGNRNNPTYGRLQEVTYCDGSTFFGDLTLDTQASIDAFRYREIIGDLTIDDAANGNITNLDGLSGLTEIGGFLSIKENASLMSLSGLEDLIRLEGALYIGNNASLPSLSGLDALTAIGGFSIIESNTSLMSVSSLASLTDIGGYLQIQSNTSLTSLSGLEMLESIGEWLRIRGNPALTDFCAVSSLIGDDKQITSGEYTVNTNSYNPSYGLISNETFCSNADGGIFVGNLTLETQASIDAFSYRGVTGNLIIDESVANDITNLDSLASLTEIGGHLDIRFNRSLTSLSGLEMLDSIGGALTITINTALTDFCSISSLIGDDKKITSGEYFVTTNGYNPSYGLISNETFCSNADGGIFVGSRTLANQAAIDAFSYRGVTGNLIIDESVANDITNLDSLGSLTGVGGDLTIFSNSSLTSLSGLEMLNSIGEVLTITENTDLTDFCAVSSLIGDDKQITSGEYTVNTNSYNPSYGLISNETFCGIFVGNLTLDTQDSIDVFHYRGITGNLTINDALDGNITNLDGLSDLTVIGGFLDIRSNTSLTSLSGLESLTEIGGYLTIASNASLTSLSGLESLTEIGGHLAIQSNDFLASLSGLESLTEIGGFLDIRFNRSLTSLSGLASLTDIGGNLYVGNNNSLTSLSGLEMLDSIGGALTILGNKALTDLRGFSSLTDIGGNLSISSNATLTSLSGLEMLDSIGGTLTIIENPTLLDFCAVSSLIGDDKQITSGEYTVNTNSYNPSYASIQTSTACSITEIILTSQAAINGFMATEVTGNLVIEEATPGDITNLNALSTLTTIGNNLYIRNNTALTSLSGLEMLDSIGDRLSITRNTALTDFCVISSLIGDDKQITSGEYSVTTNGYNPPYTLIDDENYCSNADGGIFVGNLTLDTQDSIDVFHYRGITGNLTINDSLDGNITNLDGLSELTNIGGYLRIQSNASLTFLSGLEMLESIGGALTITGNTALTDFCAVSSLIGDDKQITSREYTVNTNSYNPSYGLISNETFCSNADGGIFIGNLTLDTQDSIDDFRYRAITGNLTINGGNITNLDGLRSGLTEIGGNLTIQINPSLPSLSGLESLTEIGGALNIFFNPSLPSLSGLESLTEIGGYLTIASNSSLRSLSGLESLTEIGGFLFISSNISLTSLSGLEMLDSIGGALTILGNKALTDLRGFSSLTDIGGNLSISSNATLTSLSGLEMLDSIGGTLTIIENPALIDFCAVSSLIGDDKQITSGEYTVNTNSYNPSYASIQTSTSCSITETILTSQVAINGFMATEVTGNLVIEEATPGDITNLNALSTLTTIGNNLYIRNNTALRSLSGLEMLDSIGDRLIITGNTALTDFCAISSLVGDGNQITAGEYFVTTNGYNPSYTFIQTETLCSPSAGIFDGNLILTSQEAIDIFNYTAITGNLTINDDNTGNIMNLDSLESLTDIGENLDILSNASLTSLSGLEMLESIGGRLSITGNTALTDFCAVSSLIGDDKQITSGEYTVNTNSYNPSYGLISNETFCGIFVGNLTLDTQDSIDVFHYRGITGNLTINDALDGNITNLDGLSGLTEIGGYLWISINSSLTSLSGLESLTEIGGYLTIESNSSLTSLSGLESLTDIGGYLDIGFNSSLASLSGLESLTEIGGYLNIQNNNSLLSLSGLEALTDIGGYLYIVSNSSLTSLSGLEALTEIGGYLWISINSSLTSLSGLDSLTDIGGYLYIGNNDSLTSLSGLEALTEIGGLLSIQFNATLTSLSGLEALTEIGGYLNIFSNSSLTSLSGLEALTDIGRFLYIGFNSSLTSLSGLESLTEIGGYLRIERNPALTDFCAISSLVGDDKQITIGEYSVFGNSFYNPTYEEIQTIPGCNPPVVVVTLSNISIQLGEAFSPINLGSVFSDPNGDVLSYTVASSDTAIITAALSGDTLTLTGVGRGTAMITVTASDGDLSVSDEFMGSVTNTVPMVNAALADVTIESGAGFEAINISAVFSDANGDVLSYTVASSDTAIITAALSGDTLTLTEAGRGTAMITVTASDGDLSVSDEFMGSVTNTVPMVNAALADVTIESGAGFEAINISAVFSDANGDVLSYTVASSDTAIITAALSGDTLTLTEAGKGTAMITVTATDGGDLSVSDEFMVIIMNTAPMVADGLADVSIQQGVGFEAIDISAIFSDANGDDLSYTVGSSDSTVVIATLNETMLTLTEVSKGTAIITITATDDRDLSVRDSFMVSITNTAPTVANKLANVTIVSGAGFEAIEISETFSDVSGDELSYTVSSGDTAVVTVTLTGTSLILTEVGKGIAIMTVTATDAFDLSVDALFVVNITNNTAPTVATALADVTIEPGAGFEVINISAVFSDANGDDLSYTVASSDTAIITAALSGDTLTLTEVGRGTAMITVTASDGDLSVSDEFMGSVTNTAPMVNAALADVTIEPGAGFEVINISAVFSDANGDDLSYTVASSDTAIITAALSGDTLTLTEVGRGTAMITVTASDGDLSVSDEFMGSVTNTVPMVNDALVNVALADVTIESGAGFEVINISAVFSDANGDVLSYTVASSDETIVTAALSGDMLTLTEVGKGTAMITVTASDGDLSVSSAFMVTITNTTPTVATALTDVSIESGTAFETIDLSATFSDENGDALSYTAMSDNETVVTVSLSNTTLTLTETGTGTATITVTATDPVGLSVSDSIMITVEEGETALGIADTDILVVYPNPSSGVFELSRTVDVVSVYDMSGRLVYRGSNIKQLDLTSQPSGQYLVEVGVGKERGRYTVIKK